MWYELEGSEWDTRNIPRVRANIARIEDECNIGPNEWNILVSHEVKPFNIIIIIVNDHYLDGINSIPPF